MAIEYELTTRPDKVKFPQLLKPKRLPEPEGELLEVLDEESINEIASQYKEKDRKLLPIQEEFLTHLDQKDEIQPLGDAYKDWSLKYEIRTISRITHNKTTILKHLGRGQQPIIRNREALKSMPYEHAIADPGNRYLVTMRNEIKKLVIL